MPRAGGASGRHKSEKGGIGEWAWVEQKWRESGQHSRTSPQLPGHEQQRGQRGRGKEALPAHRAAGLRLGAVPHCLPVAGRLHRRKGGRLWREARRGSAKGMRAPPAPTQQYEGASLTPGPKPPHLATWDSPTPAGHPRTCRSRQEQSCAPPPPPPPPTRGSRPPPHTHPPHPARLGGGGGGAGLVGEEALEVVLQRRHLARLLRQRQQEGPHQRVVDPGRALLRGAGGRAGRGGSRAQLIADGSDASGQGVEHAAAMNGTRGARGCATGARCATTAARVARGSAGLTLKFGRDSQAIKPTRTRR
jgi:hypothetical protein